MAQPARQARLRALAKINLGLKILHRRSDGFHELRTIFQTISLADTLEVRFTPSRRTSISLDSSIDIADNLVLRAAQAVMEALRASGQVEFRLRKQIPMGAGLGGGSSDAAAVLLALPVLAGKPLSLERLLELGSHLGSDIPYFLLGGTALGLGRGTELYPLPDLPPRWGVVVSPGIHVSTPKAFAALRRELTSDASSLIINSFQACSWSVSEGTPGENDFEAVVFEQFPQLKTFKRTLRKLGANPAMLSGSGSALFGLFQSRKEAEQVRLAFRNQKVDVVSLVSRNRYRALWWRSLRAHIEQKTWPPRSRYAQ